jgi:hypothetical protein
MAGVLATAIMGAIVLIQFNTTLANRTAPLDLDDPVQAAIMEQAGELGNVQVPDNATAEQIPQIDQAIRLAFADTFRLCAWIGAGLAWVSALFAWFTLRMKPAEARAYVEADGTGRS